MPAPSNHSNKVLFPRRTSPSGTAKPRAPRRQSRRSSIRPDKRTHARHRSSIRPKPKGTATQTRTGGKAAAATPIRTDAPTRDKGPQRTQPDGQLRPRKTTAQTTRTRQRRAALAAQTAVGVAQSRILLRDDHPANNANKRFQRTQRRQKALFFGGTPFLLARQKKWGTKAAPTKSGFSLESEGFLLAKTKRNPSGEKEVL